MLRYIYVWDTSDDTLNRLRRITIDPLTINGFVHRDTRVTCVFEVASEALEDCIQIDRIPNSPIIVALSSKGDITFFDITNEAKGGSFCPLEHGTRAECLKIDPQLSVFRESNGHWMAIGCSKGIIVLLFVELQLLDEYRSAESDESIGPSKIYTMTHKTGDRANINSVDFRFKSANSNNVTLLAGCSDGVVRCVVFKQMEDSLKVHKAASYMHCRSTKSGSVERIVSYRSPEGSPYMISLCKMQMPFEMHNVPDGECRGMIQESTSICSELIMQKLLHDQSDQHTVLAHMRECVTDVKVSMDQSCIVFTTFNNIYILRRYAEENQWYKPSRVEWKTEDNLKHMAKVL